MKRITLAFFLVAVGSSIQAADHIMETISDNLGSNFQVVELDNKVYVIQESILKVYDGIEFVDFPTPVVGGVRLRFHNDILVHNGAVFVVMSDATRQYISRFTGSGFSRLTLPSPLVSPVVIFNGLMHMLLRTPAGVKLFSYDGTTLREIASSLGAATGSHFLMTGGSFLYISGPIFMTRYNGTSFTTITMPSGVTSLGKVFQVGSSANAYFATDEAAFYYNGSTVTELYRAPSGIRLTSKIMWRNEFYLRTGEDTPTNPERFYKYNGTTRTTISPPAGTRLVRPVDDQQLAIYRDAVYLPLEIGGIPTVYKYDGTSWEAIYDWADHGYALVVRERAGKLVFYRLLNGNHAVEYDGTTFEPFDAPEGIEWFVEPKVTTSCYHVWVGSFVVPDAGDYSWVLVKETFDADCVPPPMGGAPVIPDKLREYDRFFIGGYAHERDWCWTGIDVDWIITPICVTPPCPPPAVRTTLKDKVGKTSWEKTFTKPFSSSFLLNDTQPYTMFVSVGKDQTFTGVLLFDKDLVNKGFEEFSLDMYPKEDHFFITALTDKNKQVPFTMMLKSKSGELLWQRQFVAPLDEMVRAYVPKAGDYLQFSLAQSPKSAVSYYPNPFAGKLTINTTEAIDPVSVSLSNMNGKVVTQQNFKEPGEYSLDAGNQKPGLYILTIVEGENVRRELVEIK